MGELGLGVMIHAAFGGDHCDFTRLEVQGREIRSVVLDENRRRDGSLIVTFADGGSIELWDDGRSCCESRYLVTDDDLVYFSGSRLRDIEVASGPDVDDVYGGDHETEFLRIVTDRGIITVTAHNEHNGYYGGFWIKGHYEAE